MIDKDYFDGFEKGMKPRGKTSFVTVHCPQSIAVSLLLTL